jgi:hypothetical protein
MLPVVVQEAKLRVVVNITTIMHAVLSDKLWETRAIIGSSFELPFGMCVRQIPTFLGILGLRISPRGGTVK